MKNKKLMFGEARFVFIGKETPSLTPGSGRPKESPFDALLKMKTFLTNRTGDRLTKLSASMKVETLDLGGKVLEVDFGKPDDMKKALKSKIVGLLDLEKNKKTIKTVMGIIGVPTTGPATLVLKPLVADVFASYFLEQIKKEIDKYPRLQKYIEVKKLKDTDVKVKVSEGADGKKKIELVPKDPKFFEKYKAWVKANPKKDAKGQGKEKPGQGKEAGPSKSELSRFAKSPLGKIFRILRGEGNKTWLQLMKENKAPLAFFIAGLFGYKIGADVYNGAVDVLPDKYKYKAKQFERKARASKLGAKAYARKNPRKGAPEVGKGAEVVTSEFFGGVIKTNGVPVKGIKLDGDYKLKPGETLSVDLAGGGQVILPKGVKAYVNGELSNPGQKYENVKITFSRTIPSGTVIAGKVDLRKIGEKKEA